MENNNVFYNASISALLPTKRTIIEHSTPVLFYCYLFNVINYIVTYYSRA